MIPSTTKPPPSSSTIKFLCSYGGKIIPRHTDGKLRYHGGETRVLAVHRFISFSELLLKLGELCGKSVALSVRCQLPNEDLDALVSITSDEDLSNVIEEYNRAPSPKIRAFLSLPRKPSSPSPHASLASSSSSVSFSSSSSSSSSSNSYSATAGSVSTTPRCHHQILKPVAYPGPKMTPHHHSHHHQHHYGYHIHGNLSHNSNYLVHGWND